MLTSGSTVDRAKSSATRSSGRGGAAPARRDGWYTAFCVLLVADTPWEIWIARMASVLARLVKYLGERDFRIAD